MNESDITTCAHCGVRYVIGPVNGKYNFSGLCPECREVQERHNIIAMVVIAVIGFATAFFAMGLHH